MNPGAEQANSLRRRRESRQQKIILEILAGCLLWCFGFYSSVFIANGIEFFESKPVSYFVVVLLFAGGAVVYFLGFYHWARAKGRPGKWALVGMIPFIGLLIMGRLGERDPDAIQEPLGWSLGIGLFIALGFVSVMALIQFPMERARIQGFCERAALSDLTKFGDALKKLADERARLNCDFEVFPDNIIEFMVGPHYGWEGTSKKVAGPYYGLRMTATKPEILMRVEGDAVCACAGRGFRARNGNTRHIYRISLKDGRELPPKQGPCTGKSYGGPGATCYEESVLGPDCTYRKPRGRPCE